MLGKTFAALIPVGVGHLVLAVPKSAASAQSVDDLNEWRTQRLEAFRSLAMTSANSGPSRNSGFENYDKAAT
jgi:hypothetical protein